MDEVRYAGIRVKYLHVCNRVNRGISVLVIRVPSGNFRGQIVLSDIIHVL